MVNDYTTFWVGTEFTRVFRIKHFDLSNIHVPGARWRFKMFNETGGEKDEFAREIRQAGQDVDLEFHIDRGFFEPSMVGSIQYQISLYDREDVNDPDHLHYTQVYVGEIKSPL